ncbi:integrase [Zhengella mangrovi]|uniref:Integrase n=1 Tax=Zhengella mangrovi TaxID=1982044 RepID=A0A2G1QRU3_9HYPH|nr:site-specific integrase [Zhengella mangrovi]PHP68209.1 integrase [Zhengella mangrovi]
MSVYRRKGQIVYSYDFRHRGHRFHGPTGETGKREAQAAERAIRERVKAGTFDAGRPLTFAAAATLYWSEVGQFLKNDDDAWRWLGWLQRQLGERTLVTAIDNATVARLVALRRADGVSNATVNRSVIEPLRAIVRRARDVWGASTQTIDWRRHALREAQERIRELTTEEEARYFAALRPDYHPVMRFALLSGCRMQEILDMRWQDVDWTGRRITVTGKGDRTRRIPMSDGILDLLRPLRDFTGPVFSYESKRADKAPRGARVRISREGLKITHKRTCVKAGIEDFRFHDFRHTAATRLARQVGNLKAVQHLLGHQDIATTGRYAHVTGDDLLAAMNATESATAARVAGDKVLTEKGKRR